MQANIAKSCNWRRKGEVNTDEVNAVYKKISKKLLFFILFSLHVLFTRVFASKWLKEKERQGSGQVMRLLIIRHSKVVSGEEGKSILRVTGCPAFA